MEELFEKMAEKLIAGKEDEVKALTCLIMRANSLSITSWP